MTTSIHGTLQSDAVGTEVSFFEIDATMIGGGVFRFTTSRASLGAITWRGQVWVSASIQVSGFETGARQALPRPKIALSNVDLVIGAAAIQTGDLKRARFTRWRTLSCFLDGADLADPAQALEPDVYYFDRKTHHSATHVEWELVSSLDIEGAMIPRRQLFRDVCDRPYRRWTGSGFVTPTDRRACPYGEARYFDGDDQPVTDPARDRCAKKLTSCRLRFGAVATAGGSTVIPIPRAQGAATGNASVPPVVMTDMARAFDGSFTARPFDQCARQAAAGGVAYLGRKWGTALIVSGLTLVPPATGFLWGAPAGSHLVISLVGAAANGAFPTLGLWTVPDQTTPLDLSSGLDTSTAYPWHIVQISTSAASPIGVSQLVFRGPVTLVNAGPSAATLPFRGCPGLGRVAS